MSAEIPVANGDEYGAGGKMPMLDHLIELRSRLLKSLLAIGLAFGVCLYYAKPVSYTHLDVYKRQLLALA